MRRLHNFRAVQPLWSEPFASHPLHHWKKVHIPESNGPAQRARHSLNAFIPPTAQSCLSLGRAIETSLLYQNQQCPPPEAASCRRVASLWLQNHRTEWLTVECSSTCVCSWKRWSLWAHAVVLRITYWKLQFFWYMHANVWISVLSWMAASWALPATTGAPSSIMSSFSTVINWLNIGEVEISEKSSMMISHLAWLRWRPVSYY